MSREQQHWIYEQLLQWKSGELEATPEQMLSLIVAYLHQTTN